MHKLIERLPGEQNVGIDRVYSGLIDLYNHKDFLLKSISFATHKDAEFKNIDSLPIIEEFNLITKKLFRTFNTCSRHIHVFEALKELLGTKSVKDFFNDLKEIKYTEFKFDSHVSVEDTFPFFQKVRSKCKLHEMNSQDKVLQSSELCFNKKLY